MTILSYGAAAQRVLTEASVELRKTKPKLAKQLSALARDLNTPKWLTSTQAATLLGVSSPTTVKNWLEGGCFPGARQTPGGHYRFSLTEVLALKRRMTSNAKGLRVSDFGNEEPELPFL